MIFKDKKGFSDTGNWYKGNLHSHTTNSDGMLTPSEAIKLFKDNGYSFLCLSEHDLYTDYSSEFNTNDFILLAGLEASAILFDSKENMNRVKVHHIHGILGTKEMQNNAKEKLFEHNEKLPQLVYFGEWNGAKVAQKLCNSLLNRGCITTYNHPIWSRVRENEFVDTKGLWGLEIFNYNTVNESGTGYDVTFWDIMLREGKQIYGFASDDNHNEGIFDDSLGGYIVVKAEKLTHDDIINNMLCGNFYSSNGPEIYDWGINNNIVYIDCSEVNRINFIVGNFVNSGRTVMCDNINDTITTASLKLNGDEKYVRVECVDKYGKVAWTNAIFLN